MKRGDDGIRLRIFIDESLRYDHKPLYEHLVERARRDGLAGATVLRGMEGYGAHRRLHTTRLIDVSVDLPVIVELIDSADAIRRFLASLDGVIAHGTATLSPVHIIKYSPGSAEAPFPPGS